jgi:hypothetical protein
MRACDPTITGNVAVPSREAMLKNRWDLFIAYDL